jgi:PAS domain S-box-containing protein
METNHDLSKRWLMVGVTGFMLIAVMFLAWTAKNIQRAFADSRAIIRSLPIAVVAVGNDDRIRMANATAEQIFGYGPNELPGRPFNELLTLESTEISEVVLRELIARRKDGKEVRVVARMGPSVNGGERYLVAVLLLPSDVEQILGVLGEDSQ